MKKSVSVAGVVIVVLAFVPVLVFGPFITVQTTRTLTPVPYASLWRLISDYAPLSEIQQEARSFGVPLTELYQINSPFINVAIDNERLDLLEWLLSEGYPPNGPGWGRHPLVQSMYNDCLPCAEKLLRHGADPLEQIELGHFDDFTPMRIAELKSERREFVLLFKEHLEQQK